MLPLSCPQALRRPGTLLGTAVIILAAVCVAVSGALVREAAAAGGGRDLWYGERRSGSVADPMRWFRYSSERFQRLMSMLAVRSAAVGGRASRLPPPPDEDEPHDEPQAWPDDWRDDAPPPPRRNGGEAGAGPNRSSSSAVRVKDWYERRSPSCRHSGAIRAGRSGWYVVRDGDTLWSIAEAHYGYGGAYRRILHANRERIADSGLIYTCQRLYIPHWRWAPCYAERGAGADS